jgi:hypothetical protein
LERPVLYRNGAPRPMKMGTIASLSRYDAAARNALQSANLRRIAILHCASRAAVFPISQGGPVTLRLRPFDRSRERRDGPFATLGAGVSGGAKYPHSRTSRLCNFVHIEASSRP